MKNKSAVLSVLGMAMFLSVSAYAAGARGAKNVKMLTNTAAAVPVASGAVTVYSVILGTGAVTDYIVLFDSANATATTAIARGSTFRGQYHPVAATVTQITFDPPLIFNNGLTAINATALTANGLTWAPGKELQ